MPLTITPREFVTKWKSAELKESAAAQEHFIDMCRLVGHQTPAEMDPAGRFFTFEAGAQKQGGEGQGFADVWYRGRFAWEYKGKHADLNKAYQQLLLYREALENPPLLIVSDIDSIEIHTNFTNTVKKTYRIELDDLLEPDKLGLLRAAFYSPESLIARQTPEEVTQEAAAKFARMAEILRGYGEEPREIAHFLIRMLFSLFAEDVRLLPENILTHLIEQTSTKSEAFTAQLSQLFKAMNSGGWFGAEEIRNFDGNLFEDDRVLQLDSECLEILVSVCNLDWGSIEPSIFGTLFERSLDPGKRAQLGAHYTSKEDILLIVEPVLMAPLRRKLEEIKESAVILKEKRDDAKKGQRTKYQKRLSNMLMGFAEELAQVQVLDPACGSGNFLYVALRQLLDLEKEVISLAGDLNVGRFFPSVNPSQLHGIEINEYAQQLAQATIWIGYIQWFIDNGFGFPSEPILKPLDNILLMDAILAYDEEGIPVDPEWPKADVIIGNPPFLGDKKMRTELGDEYVDDLRKLFADRIPGQSDLVCYWFEKSREMLENNKLRRSGLLATQGIRGGANRVVLDRINEIGMIFWAESDRNWILDGAIVHVSMLGFDSGAEIHKSLDGSQVEVINSDLTSFADLTQAKQLNENLDLSFIGTQKSGPFDLTQEQAVSMLKDSGNPNNRSNSDVIKPWVNAIDITRRPRSKWVINFGFNMPIDDAAQYEKPFEYVKEYVKPKREGSKPKSQAEKWWLFARPRPAMFDSIKNLSKFIVTPMVSKHRIFVWLSKEFIPENLLVVLARDDDYFFGVVHSFAHEIWSRNLGTQLRDATSGQRYTPTTTFETFPFPWPPGDEPVDDIRVQEIAEAARELDEYRSNWLNPPELSEKELKKRTLTNLYNERPTWLDLAHKKLDEAVFAAYGWPDGLGDEKILERLLKLNLERAG